MSLSKQIISTLRQIEASGIPESVREKVVLHICDTVGISLAAYKGAPVALQSIQGVTLGSSGGVSGVIGSNKQLPPAFAAFSNTALAHALDYDDIHDKARIHPTPIILAACLAVSPMKETKDIDLVTAVALGNELLCRLGYALEPKGVDTDARWFLSQLFGYIGAAVAAGLVLGLDDLELGHAIGLAYMQTAGGKEAGVGVGSNARAIYPAFASMGGVQATLLAKQGVTAPDSVLDGKTGLFPIYFNKQLNASQQQVLLDTDRWVFMDTTIKLFPSCRYSHPYIHSALELRRKYKLDEIKRIVIEANETAAMLCHPFQERCNPKTIQDAKFSIPFMVAFTFVHGAPNLANMPDHVLRDPAVLHVTERIDIHETEENVPGLPQGRVRVITESGSDRNKEQATSNVTFDQVKSKFIACCKYADVAQAELLWESLCSGLADHLLEKLPILDS